MNKKLILSDVDGVLLNWKYAFDIWIQHHHGFSSPATPHLYESIEQQYGITSEEAINKVQLFNESAAIGFLPPLRDSVEYVSKLAKLGYKIHAITSVGTDENTIRLRKMNLEKIFGNVFDTIDCLPLGASKQEYLLQYKDSGLIWIEDTIHHAETGVECGLQSILMVHGYNDHCRHPDIHMAPNWEYVYNMVV